MGRWWTSIGVIALVLALADEPPHQASAQEPVQCRFEREGERGFGGTGITNVLSRLIADPNADSGLGGTGLTDETERGFGGTGVIAMGDPREGGIGGTGIIGVVTGFASICVNGYEVEVTPDTVIDVEGFAAEDADIRLGQVVAVEAYPEDGTLVASSVSIQVAVAGPVESITADAGQLTVAGQTLQTETFGGSASLDGVTVGDWVVASGLRRSDDVIAATSVVEVAEAGAQVFLSGTVRETASGLALGGVTIESDAVTVGDTVVVQGRLTNGSLEPSRIAARVATPFSSGVRVLSVQSFDGDGRTRVQTEGPLDASGQFTPANTEVPPPPMDGAVPQKALPAFGAGPGGGPGPGPLNNGPLNNGPFGGTPPGSGAAQQFERPSGVTLPDTLERPARPEMPSRPETPTRPERFERPERLERPERPERPDRPDRPQRPNR